LKNYGTLQEDLSISVIISRSVILIMRNVQTKVVEKIKTHILCSTSFPRKSSRLWGNAGKYTAQPERSRETTPYGACAFHAGYLMLQTHPE